VSTQVYDIAPSLVLITTAEPCPMCAGSIEWSGFATVYYGTSIPFIASHGQNQVRAHSVVVATCAVTLVTAAAGIVVDAAAEIVVGVLATQIMLREEEVARAASSFRKTTVIGGVLESECNELYV
jgi:tRNA(Arg) A34 adenosine deaminase TadA